MDRDKLKLLLESEKTQDGLMLTAAGGGLLVYSVLSHLGGSFGGWAGSPYLFPAGVSAVLLALALRLLWAGVRNDPLAQDYTYPDEAYLDESTLDGIDIQDLFVDVPLTDEAEPPPDSTVPPAPKRTGRLVWAVLAVTLIYCLLMPLLGFLLSTMGYLAVLLILAGEHRWTVVGLCSALTSAGVYLVFSALLGVALP